MTETSLIIVVADGFDAKPLLSRFAVRFERRGENTWAASFATDLHGLAVLEHGDPSEILSLSGDDHPVDADGWADWRLSAPGEHEMTEQLLPPANGPSAGKLAWRYDSAYWWDPNADPINVSLARDLGLSEPVDQMRELAAGKGDFIWKAMKFGWKAVGVASRISTIYAILDYAGAFKPLQQESVRQRLRMEQQEQWRREAIQLAEVRRHRLERGSASSRQKARQYYTTLDALIAANS
jgi:hypothetical protein